MGVETNEHLFRWSEFKDHLRNLIEHHPNIELREHTEVEQIVRNLEGQTRFSFSLLTSTPAPRDATNDDLSTGIIQYQV